MNSIASVAFAALIFTQLSCASLFKAKAYSVQKAVVYKSVPGMNLTADLYLPNQTDLRPAVLVVHGGGWDSRSGDMESICETLAQAGFVVMNTTYRLAPEHLYPQAVDDVRDSLLWLFTNADRYHINTKKISGWGYSAGANLILLAGLDPKQSLKAIVAGGTPADLTAWPNSPLVNKFLGHSLKDRPDLWQQASPVNHVEKNSPPVFMYHGEWDTIVEIEQMDKMRDALLKQNVTVETHRVSLMGHLAVYFFSSKSVELGLEFIKKQEGQ